jgi:uncharacterized protein
MNSHNEIERFLNSESFAIVGVSRSKKKFGNVLYTEFTKKGKRVYGINHKIDGPKVDDVYKNFNSLPEKVDAAIINIKPQFSLDAVKDAHTHGVNKIWIQQGAQSIEAIQYCQDNGISVINDMCVLMFTDPGHFPHNFHKWVLNLFGKLPE